MKWPPTTVRQGGQNADDGHFKCGKADGFDYLGFCVLSASAAASANGLLPMHSGLRSASPIASAAALAGAAPPPSDSGNLTAELSVGTGRMLCPVADFLPTLESATACDGLAPELDDISVTLTPQPAGKPEWKLWSGKYSSKIEYKGLEANLELLLSYAKVDGKIYSFVEGRVVTGAKTATYFAQVVNQWSQLQATTAFGQPIPAVIGSDKSLWIPYIQFAKKDYVP